MRWIRASLLIAAIFLAGYSVYYHLLASEARSWPETAGTVVSSHVRAFGAGSPAEAGDPNRYVHMLRYQYSVDGAKFVGSDLGLADSTFLPPRTALRRVVEIPRGSAVRVYYDPRNPSRSVLDREYPWVAITTWTILALACLICAAFVARIGNFFRQWLLPDRTHVA